MYFRQLYAVKHFNAQMPQIDFQHSSVVTPIAQQLLVLTLPPLYTP